MDLRGPNLIFFLIATASIVSLSEAHQYHVGGTGGWIVNPHIRYNHWSDRTRFVVNDSLVFKYEKGEDSVLLVTKDGYYNCDTKNPVERWEDGASEVALNRSGPFFFISGEEEHCHKGQKLIVVVLPWAPQPPISVPPESPVPHPPHASPSYPPAVSPGSPEHHHTPPPSSTPAPHSSPPSPSTAPSLSPADHPPASAPSPVVIPPAHSPTSTPTEAPPSQPTVSPSPSSDTPTPVSPAPAPEAPSSSAITARHAPWVLAALTLLVSAMS